MGLNRRGFSKVEIIIIIFVTVVLIAIGVIIIGQRAQGSKRSFLDGHIMQGIHQSWLIFAREYDGQFPSPGVIKRLPVNVNGVMVFAPGQGEIDISQNTTANLFSVAIMMNYYTPELCVGMTEPSDNVRVDEDYNWDRYSPEEGVYWDNGFQADLDGESNVSYAHMPLFGERMESHWREGGGAGLAVLGNRGPRNGEDLTSITLRIHRPYSKWSGYVINSDNSRQMITSSVYGTVDIAGKSVPDHLFQFEDGPGGLDAFLGFTKEMTEDGPVLSWD